MKIRNATPRTNTLLGLLEELEWAQNENGSWHLTHQGVDELKHMLKSKVPLNEYLDEAFEFADEQLRDQINPNVR
jgi:hypothetical protein